MLSKRRTRRLSEKLNIGVKKLSKRTWADLKVFLLYG